MAKFRYRQEEQNVLVRLNEDKTIKVIFDNPQKAVTVGQYVVFYLKDICLGL